MLYICFDQIITAKTRRSYARNITYNNHIQRKGPAFGGVCRYLFSNDVGLEGVGAFRGKARSFSGGGRGDSHTHTNSNKSASPFMHYLEE